MSSAPRRRFRSADRLSVVSLPSPIAPDSWCSPSPSPTVYREEIWKRLKLLIELPSRVAIKFSAFWLSLKIKLSTKT
ncbi:hypothetical protein L2E82_13072 [Cichorium intybus]|uniref:Uncharacterized protein n=1 Tax=Cichorium intybus TaxID=13427 RepID=A0ACB9GIU7_CICIN|nr:hypothetical protein L2E82_13072 [Cichorium intybus]